MLINFWATWCSPCKAELPDLITVSKEFEPLGLKVLGISIDRGGDVDTLVGNFVKEHNINYDVIIDDGSLQKAFGNIRGVPTTFIVGKDGKIAESFVGARPKNFFVAKINKYIQ
jgi:thiol-disulfide isomerase/thioredoxin